MSGPAGRDSGTGAFRGERLDLVTVESGDSLRVSVTELRQAFDIVIDHLVAVRGEQFTVNTTTSGRSRTRPSTTLRPIRALPI
jgi:hypothetical protein